MAPTLSDLTGHYPILCSLFAHLEIHDIFNIARTCKQSWDHICVDEDNFDNLITKTACKGRGETWGTDEGPGGLLYIHHYRDNARHHAENIACDHAEKRVCETCKHTICKSCKFRHWDALAMYALPRNTYPPFLIHHEEPQVIQYRAVHDMWFCKSCVPKRFGWTARQMTPCDCRDGELWWYKEEYAGDCARCYDCRRKELADRVNAAHDFFRDNAGARRWLESGNGERHNVLVKSCEWCETSVGEEKFIVVCPQCWKRAKRHRSARPPNRTYDWYTFELGNEDENEENGVQEENDVQDQNSVHEENNAEGDNSARREDSVQGKRTAGQMLLRARKALANMCRSLSRRVRE